MSKNINRTTSQKTERLYVLPIRNVVAFPELLIPLVVEDPVMVEVINRVVIEQGTIGLFAEPEEENPRAHQIYKVGTRAEILKMSFLPDGGVRLLVQGLERIRIQRLVRRNKGEEAVEALVLPWPFEIKNAVRCEALLRAVKDLLEKLAGRTALLPEELIPSLLDESDVRRFACILAANLGIRADKRQDLLEKETLDGLLETLLEILQREWRIVEMTGELKVQEPLPAEPEEREKLLREHLRALKKDLGEEEDEEEEDEWEAEIEDLRKQIKKAGMPKNVEEVALKELERLAEMPPAAAEYTISRTYIDWLISLPWSKETEDNMDLENAKKILDEDHYDLKDVKDRILEYLAVRKLKKRAKGPILCFVGPPGVGKTSLGRSIARAMGRRFVRFSVGGIRDEAEIRGHRRTYIGALPGRIIQMIKEAGTRNPVFMLDEIDKMGSDFRGDPASALLEALDPEQNKDFVDHYLDVKFDLSRVMFITTANMLYDIPPALLDRLEVIEIPGYITEEKIQIARKYLVPRQIAENGLRKKDVKFRVNALERIITDYTDEAGVRNLEREIATICRKIARRFAEGKGEPVVITAENVPEYLGPPKNFPELAGLKDEVGIATGLAWTPTGGEILFVESTLMKGGKHLTLTGQLGDVMRESAQAALSFLRSHAEKYGIDPDFYQKYDIHVHVPSGAVPKDGPSAGVTIATSLLSLLTCRPVRHDVAMTGEISLRGRVLPVGGIKEKVLAAQRAGIKTVIMPARNERDLQEVPEKIRKKMKFIFVEKLHEVFEIALRKETVARTRRSVSRKARPRKNVPVTSVPSRLKEQDET